MFDTKLSVQTKNYPNRTKQWQNFIIKLQSCEQWRILISPAKIENPVSMIVDASLGPSRASSNVYSLTLLYFWQYLFSTAKYWTAHQFTRDEPGLLPSINHTISSQWCRPCCSLSTIRAAGVAAHDVEHSDECKCNFHFNEIHIKSAQNAFSIWYKKVSFIRV